MDFEINAPRSCTYLAFIGKNSDTEPVNLQIVGVADIAECELYEMGFQNSQQRSPIEASFFLQKLIYRCTRLQMIEESP